MEQALGREKVCEGSQTGFRLPQMVQHANGIDVVEGRFIAQIQKAPLFLPQRSNGLTGFGTFQALSRHSQGPIADVNANNISTGVEVTQIIGADPGATTRVKNAWLLLSRWDHAIHRGQHTAMTPTPVVSRRGAVLERISRKGEAVIKRTHHWGGGITGSGFVHQLFLHAAEHFMAIPSPISTAEKPANICSWEGEPTSNEP